MYLLSNLVILIEKLSNFLIKIIIFILWPLNKKFDKEINILVFRVGNIGDIICSLPAINELKKKYPKSNILLLTSPGNINQSGAKDFLYDQFIIDEIISYNLIKGKKIKTYIDLFFKLKKKHIDLWIDLPSQFDGIASQSLRIFFAKICGCKYAYGWQISTINIFKKIQSRYRIFPNEYERLYNIINPSQKLESKENLIRIPKEDEQYSFNILKDNNFLNRKIAGLAPCAKRSTNLWEVKKFVNIIKYLIDNDYAVIIFGGKNDIKYCENFTNVFDSNVLSLAGKTTILQSFGILKYCNFLISVDSGVQHMASILNIKTISIFSARDYSRKWYPYGKKNIVIRKNVSCEVCLVEVCKKDNYCMKSIEAIEVIDTLKKNNF